MDLSPNYAGTVMGVVNMVGNVTGFVTPYIVGTIINGNVRDHSYKCLNFWTKIIVIFHFSSKLKQHGG